MTTVDVSDRNFDASAVFRAFWRWHFYAGLLVLPILMLMALTGGLYLFKDEIDSIVYRPMMVVEQRAGSTNPEAWVRAVEAGVGGQVVQVAVPDRADRSVRLVVEAPDGTRKTAFVDPHDARLLGAIPEGGVMQWVKRLHSLDIGGPVANLMVEVVAGWSIVMVTTGIVLWWPRGQAGGIVSVRSTPGKRLFWRDLHAVVGLFAGAVIVFLAATGMPWSAVWGQQVRSLTTEAGWGRPPAPASAATWGHGPSHAPAEAGSVPWSLEHVEMHSAHHGSQRLSLNDAVTRIEASDLGRPYVLSIPTEVGKAWSASHMPAQVERTRTLYLDGADGRVIADIGYGAFGPAAQAIEWGISVHQGNQFGAFNKLVMLAGCIAVWLLGISAVTMWWKRRPKGRIAAPPAPADRRAYWAVAAIVIPLGLIYPLVGASLIAVLLIDFLVRRIMPVLRRLSGATS